VVVINDFQYFKPIDLQSALKLLESEHPIILAGGTDLLVRIHENELDIENKLVLDIKGLEKLNIIEEHEGTIFIGALITFSDILDSEVIKNELSILWEAASTVASVGIRNRATLVGNICSAVPSLDSGPALLVHDTYVVTKSRSEERKIPIQDWFTGPKQTALKPDELVIGLEIQRIPEKTGSTYLKLGRYRGEDLAQVGVGTLYKEGQHRVAFCAVGPIPKRAKKIEKLLNDKDELSDSLIEKATRLVDEEIAPISDIRASKKYRLQLAKIMLEKGLKETQKRFEASNEIIGAVIL